MARSAIGIAASIAAVVLPATATETLAQTVPDDFAIKLERTACYGECPDYSVIIDAKGNVTYEGKRFVRVEGRQTDRIPASRVAALADSVERVGFFALRDRYRAISNPDGTETIVTDLPTTFVTVTRGGRTKRVEDYFGAPPGLKELGELIDQTARTTRWTRVDAATLRQLVEQGGSPSAEERAELLRKALLYDEVDVVRALIEIGADPHGRDGDGYWMSLMLIRSAAAARVLLEAGADPFARTSHGGTALGSAVYLAPEVTDVLLKAGVRADEPSDSDGRTPLWQAACAGNAGAVKLLLGAGADPAPHVQGMSALQCARERRDYPQAAGLASWGGKRPFVEDFSGVVTLLEQALTKRKSR